MTIGNPPPPPPSKDHGKIEFFLNNHLRMTCNVTFLVMGVTIGKRHVYVPASSYVNFLISNCQFWIKYFSCFSCKDFSFNEEFSLPSLSFTYVKVVFLFFFEFFGLSSSFRSATLTLYLMSCLSCCKPIDNTMGRCFSVSLCQIAWIYWKK